MQRRRDKSRSRGSHRKPTSSEDWFTRHAGLLLPIGLMVLTLLVFGQTLRHPFVLWDDDGVAHNPDYLPPNFGKIGDYWTNWQTGHRQFYVPVVYTLWFFAAAIAYAPHNSQLWPMHAGPFHALSLLAHLAAVLAVYGLLRRLVRKDWAAAAGAAVFAIHPIQVEAAAWASTLYTPLSTAFALWAMSLFLKFAGPSNSVVAENGEGGHIALREAGGKQRWGWYAAATGLYALALLTKPSVVLVPILTLAIDVLLLGRRGRQAVFHGTLLVPWLAMAAAGSYVLAFLTQPSTNVVRPAPLDRLLIASDSLTFYLSKVLLPINLAPDYGRTPQWALANASLWVSAAIVVVASIGSLAWVKRFPWVFVGWMVFVLGMVATLGLVPFGYQVYSTVADRYAYLSMFGVALIVGFGIATMSNRWSQRSVTFAAGGVVLLLTILSIWQTSLWSSTGVLFNHGLAVNPNSAAAHAALGVMLDQDRKPQQAAPYLLRAAELRPDDMRYWQYAGRVQAQNRQFDDAIRLFRKAIDLYQAGHRSEEAPDNAYTMLGAALAQSNRPVEAEQAMTEAVRLNPANIDARRNLAFFYESQNRPELALPQYEAALKLAPSSAMLQQAVARLKNR